MSKKPFRIISQELECYRNHNLPIPRKLFDRKCDKCGIDMKTTYSPDREEVVYWEECYNKEVY